MDGFLAISGSIWALAGAAFFSVDRLIGKDPGQGIEQLGWFDGLAEIRCKQIRFCIRLHCRPREVNSTSGRDLELFLALRIFPGQGNAIHLRHVHIQDGQVERVAALDPLQGFFGRFAVARLHAPIVQLQGQDAAVGGIVVHDQDAFPVQVTVGCRCRSRRVRSGISTASVWMVKWKADPSPGTPVLSAHKFAAHHARSVVC